MTKVLTFPTQTPDRIPKPYNYREGERYSYLSFGGDAALIFTLPTTAVYVIKEGDICDGLLHAIKTPNGATLAQISVTPDDELEVVSILVGFASGVFRREDVDVIGNVVEYWPKGWGGPCWVLNPEREAAARPLLQVSS